MLLPAVPESWLRSGLRVPEALHGSGSVKYVSTGSSLAGCFVIELHDSA